MKNDYINNMTIIYIETEELNAKKFIAVSTFQYIYVSLTVLKPLV